MSRTHQPRHSSGATVALPLGVLMHRRAGWWSSSRTPRVVLGVTVVAALIVAFVLLAGADGNDGDIPGVPPATVIAPVAKEGLGTGGPSGRPIGGTPQPVPEAGVVGDPSGRGEPHVKRSHPVKPVRKSPPGRPDRPTDRPGPQVTDAPAAAE